jgi:uncharacterized cupredoxin-like copper-binding protein
MSRARRIGVAVVVAVAVGAGVATAASAVDSSHHRPPPLGPGVVTVHVGIDHSHFDLGPLRVVEGTVLRFVVHNDDPIDHELIVGPPDVHRRHEAGTEATHTPVPGEVSVAPGATAMTFYEVTTAGPLTYACHLPGHVAYGMVGVIDVVSA